MVCLCAVVLLRKPQEAAPLNHIGHTPSVDGPSPVPLSQYLAKLSDVCLSVDVKRVNFNISVNTVHKSVPSRTPVTTLVVTPLPSPPLPPGCHLLRLGLSFQPANTSVWPRLSKLRLSLTRTK